MPIDLIPLKSSAITGYHHDPASSVLTVEYTGGRRYEHADVPAATVERWLKADSLGGHFNSHIKPHHPAKAVGR